MTNAKTMLGYLRNFNHEADLWFTCEDESDRADLEARLRWTIERIGWMDSELARDLLDEVGLS